MKRESMFCPKCGIPMNYHADKLGYLDGEEAVEEIHSCPNCGGTELRSAE